MSISVFDIFSIGIGPSSSHTVGPMRAAGLFAEKLRAVNQLSQVVSIKAELFGSLGATGKGHGSPNAVILGLEGEHPETVDIDSISERVAHVRSSQRLQLGGSHSIHFDPVEDLILHSERSLELHANGMSFSAFGSGGKELCCARYYSVGGGFVLDEAAAEASSEAIVEDPTELAFPFSSGEELLALCDKTGLSISDIMWRNEQAWRSEQEIRDGLTALWNTMQQCVKRGMATKGILPGGLDVKRRAHKMYEELVATPEAALADPLTITDWVMLYALAVNEENASGGCIVTAPTNGAAGIIPAVLHYYMRFCQGDLDGVHRFLLVAAIGILYKKNASISGAEVGCQGEVGSACSMAAGALAEVLKGTPRQVENAAEIAMEHNLGLTCDPVGGLVQVPCIERNAMASIKAITSTRMALRGDGSHFVSLDKVIKTMRETGRDMQDKYKETARGGLATHVVEVPVNIVEC